jgi:hypothetical protein
MLDHFIERPQVSWFPRSTKVIYPDSLLEEQDFQRTDQSIVQTRSVETEFQNSDVQLQQRHQSLIEFPAAAGKDIGLDGIISSDLKLFYNVYISSALSAQNAGRFTGHEDPRLQQAFLRSSAGSVWFTRSVAAMCMLCVWQLKFK